MLTLDLRDTALTPGQHADRRRTTTHSFVQLLSSERFPALRRFVLRVWVEEADVLFGALDWEVVDGALERMRSPESHLDAFVVDLAWWKAPPTKNLQACLPATHERGVAQLRACKVSVRRFWQRK